jgi:glycerol-3-phosphate acyltransferase PlsY
MAPAAGVLLGAVALLAGYLVGSLPAANRIGRMAGVDLGPAGATSGGTGAVWRLAGPGWGFLALTADLAKGVVPVAIGMVTFSWTIGWIAGLGAVLGAGWPALGHTGGDRGLATVGGAAFTLGPPAGTLSVLLGVAVLAIGRLARRDTRTLAIATGVGSYPVVFLLVQQDVAMLAGLLVLYLVAGVRLAPIRER